MNNSDSHKLFIAIVGPTAIGKTAISIELAKEFETEIISADSRQFYKQLKIGSATPTTKELNTVKHHFIGNLSVTDYYNVSKFETEVIDFLNIFFSKNKYAIMVGGSGLYINAVCYGIDELPDVDETLREHLKSIYKTSGIEPLQKQLKKLDPEYYSIVDLPNHKRLMRALEVCIITGKTYTSFRNKTPKKRNFRIIKIGLNRERTELFDIINKRVDKMIEQGLIDEVKNLYQFKNRNALNTVGYKEIFDYLDNKIKLEKAIENIKTNTRRYAKRQLTWFKKDKSIHWFHPDDKEKIIDFIKTN
ncbi:MAG: tRNA (adenosine(37)-N6)-dimethylallyltransferase MiaA [Bacteroidales bacterium]|nr:tRNA (adenosine(37)-N6)-dimethylallyltransferase MiaA [Bacteroidales bacterium]